MMPESLPIRPDRAVQKCARLGAAFSFQNRTRAHLTRSPKRGRFDTRQIFNCQRSRGGFARTAPETARPRAVPATHSASTSSPVIRPCCSSRVATARIHSPLALHNPSALRVECSSASRRLCGGSRSTAGGVCGIGEMFTLPAHGTGGHARELVRRWRRCYGTSPASVGFYFFGARTKFA
jgi:hypothetical protein